MKLWPMTERVLNPPDGTQTYATASGERKSEPDGGQAGPPSGESHGERNRAWRRRSRTEGDATVGRGRVCGNGSERSFGRRARAHGRPTPILGLPDAAPADRSV